MKLPNLLELPEIKVNKTREILAMHRTKLANERTLLAYIRASLYLFLGGIAIVQLKDFYDIRWIGFTAICLSGALLIFGLTRFVLLKSKLRKWNRILLIDEKEK